MAYSLKKMLAAMAVTLTAATSFVSADAVTGNYCCPQPCDPCAQCPVTHPVVDGCGNWFAEVDVLYWRASECGLAYASKHEFSTSECGDFSNTDIKNPKFRWDVGIRLGLGYAFSCGWDVGLYWTHFQTRAHGKTVNDPDLDNALLFPAYGTLIGVSDPDQPFPGGPDTITARWKFHLDLADLELGREFCIGPCVTLRPFVGVRAAWTKQTYHILVEDHFVGGDDSRLTNFQDIKLRSEFKGAGIRGGFDTEWHVGCGFSIYGNAAVSVLYGRSHSEINEHDFFFTEPYDEDCFETDFHQSDRWLGCRAITDVGLGIRWRQFYCCDTVAVTLGIGWEHHMFFNENRFEDFNYPVEPPAFGEAIGSARSPQFTRGDLCVQGWVFSAKVEF